MRVIPGLGLSIPSNWKLATLGDVTSKIGSGATPRGGSAVYISDGPALIRSQNVHDNVFRDEGLVFLSDRAADALKGVSVQEGDVLINITGDSILRTCLVPRRVLPARVNQHVAIVRSDGQVDPGFLQKWLSQPLMKDFMLGHSSGGTRKAITKGHLQGFPIPLPPIEEQHGIAATLNAIDAKIESNQRAVKLAERLGDHIFLSRVTSQVKLSRISTITMGTSPPGVSYNEISDGVPFYQGTRDFGVRFPERRVWTTAPVRLATANDALFSVRAPVGEVNRAREICCVGRGVAAISSGTPSALFYALRNSAPTWEPFQGEGTVFGAVNKADLGGALVPWPSGNQIADIEERLGALDEKIKSLVEESEKLVRIRDALLPEILFGRIRVPEAQGGQT